MTKYHWYSIKTGEIATDFLSVIKITLQDLKYFHILDLWKYSRKGW